MSSDCLKCLVIFLFWILWRINYYKFFNAKSWYTYIYMIKQNVCVGLCACVGMCTYNKKEK